MPAGSDMKRKPSRITVETFPMRLGIAINSEDEYSPEEDSPQSGNDSPLSPKILPFRTPRTAETTPMSAAFERKALRSASLGNVTTYVSRDAQKQFRIKAALGSFRDRVLSPVPSPPPFSPAPLSAASSLPTPQIEVSPPESPEKLEPEADSLQGRAQLNQRILSLASKRNSGDASADNLLSRHNYLLPSLEAIAAKYQEKLKVQSEQPRAAPKRKLQEPAALQPKSPKSPKSSRGKSLRELLERRTAVQSAA